VKINPKIITISTVVLFGVFSGVFMYHSRTNAPEQISPVVVISEVPISHSLPVQYTVPLKVLSASSDSGVGVAQIIQFKGDFESLDAINNKLMSSKNALCALIDSPEFVSKSHADTVYGEERGVAITTDDMIQAMKDRWIYSELGMKTEFINSHIISISTVQEYYCGGPYPDHGASGMNFVYSKKINTAKDGLVSPYEISFYNIFADYEDNLEKIYMILAGRITQNADESCFGGIDSVSAGELLGRYGEKGSFRDPVSYYITKEGMVLQSMFLNHAMGVCEPVGIMIEWGEFGELVNQDFLSLVRQ
jgi:hypothetical protein